MNNKNTYSGVLSLLRELDWPGYANIKYNILTHLEVSVLKKLYENTKHSFDELIEYFESIEEYEKCKVLLNLKKEVS